MAAQDYDTGLDRVAANHQPLTPLLFLERAAATFPEHIAVVHGPLRRPYRELRDRCVRLASALKDHSPTWKATDTSKMDDATFDIVRSAVYSEAKQAARNPVNVPSGQLRMVERKNDGHTIREFHGQPKTWMDQFAGPVQMRGEGRFLHPNLGQQ